MKKSSEISRTLPFYLFAGGVFLIIVYKYLLSNGMFLDGLIYSTVSKNLAEGIGTFWNSHFTSTCLPDFHEHPPLAFGIQSIFFSLLGESRFVDRFYTLLTLIITGCVILKIWKTLGYRNGWLPLFLWIITPTVFWASYNNLLENTLTIFTSLSILFYLKYHDNQKFYFIILSGLVLAFGFLTKGFVAFFPWIFIFTLAPLLLLILFFPDARLSLHKYIDNQVINSIRNIITVDSRFDILKRLFSELTLAAVLCILFLIPGWIRKSPKVSGKENMKKAMVFLALGLTGVLPIMISMKQSGFYILPTYPVFSIGISILIYPFLNSFLIRINYSSKSFLFFKWISYGLFSTGIILSLCNSD